MFYRLSIALVAVSAVLAAGALVFGQTQPHSVLAFVSERSGRAQVYLLDVDRLITRLVSRNDFPSDSPAWSLDGDLAYVRSTPEGRDVIVYNPFTGRYCEVNGRLLDESSPAWSPDGKLAYVVGMNGRFDVYVQAGCDGRTARIVTQNSAHFTRNPRWSSAGRLVYTDEPLFGGVVAVILDPASDDSRVIRRSGGLLNLLTWFDDHLLAFLAVDEFDNPNFEIMVYDDRTGEFHNVSNHPAIDMQSAWSPDGRLAFTSNRDGNNEIYVFDFASNSLTNVSQSPRDDQMPAWSPDGRLAYMSAVGSAFDIIVVDRVLGGTPRVVVSHPSQDYNPLWMP